MAELKLSAEDMAMTAFRAFARASGVDEPNWDHLAEADQQRWFALAKKAEAELEALQGKSYSLAAERLAAVWSDDADFWSRLPDEIKLAWQAAARHVVAVLDCDEIDSLESLERSWSEWAGSRRERR